MVRVLSTDSFYHIPFRTFTDRIAHWSKGRGCDLDRATSYYRSFVRTYGDQSSYICRHGFGHLPTAIRTFADRGV